LIKVCNLSQALFIFFLVFVLGFETYFELKLFIIVVVSGFCSTIYYGASRNCLNYILAKDDLIHGNSLLEICIQGGAIFAALLIGILYDEFGFKVIFIMMASSFLVSSFLIKNISIKDKQLESSYFQQINLGFHYLKKNKNLLIFGLAMALPAAVTLASNNVLPGYVKNYLHGNSFVFGVADMLFGIGALLSGFFVSFINLKNNSKKMKHFYFLSILILLILFFSNNVYIFFICYLLFGFSNTILKIVLNSEFMMQAHEKYYGQMLLLFNVVSNFFQIFLVICIAGIMDFANSSSGYLILGCVIFLSYFINILANNGLFEERS
jgi:predicted MFS family arabinose efflux permease